MSLGDVGSDAGSAAPEAPDAGPAVVCGEPGDLRFLHTLDGLEGCTVFRGSIHVSDTDARDLTALPELSVVEERLTFFRNSLLASARGLERLQSAGKLGFSHHDRLADVSALANVRVLPGELYFISNPALESLHGLEGLRSVGALRVLSNDRLRSLYGLAGLVEVTGDLDIRGNAALPSAEIDAFVARLSVGGTITVSENGP